MKKIYSTKLIICIIIFLSVGMSDLKAQMVYLPDTNFSNELRVQGYGSCIVGDSIDSSCPLVVGTTVLNVSSSNIYDLQGLQAFTNLHKLNCDTNHLATIPPLPVLLDTLFCKRNLISSFPPFPDSLKCLDCTTNQLSILPALPGSLIYLNCNGNHLTALPLLDSSLKCLACAANQLTSLPSLPNSLNQLGCYSNQLTSLPALDDSLNLLDCGFNHITVFPALPDSLKYFYCYYNQITVLPTLPANLHYLDCSYNFISNLNLSPFLEDLDCAYNLLAVLPPLPVTLKGLFCSNNQLTSLPSLPPRLSSLYCANNQLTTITAIPPSVNILVCNNNVLNSLSDLPEWIDIFNCSNNPNLQCLPMLKDINDLNFTNTGVSCLPNYGNIIINSNPLLSSLPLCNFFNDEGCNIFWNISGKSFFDTGGNCYFDTNSVQQHNIHIMLSQGGNLVQQTFTGGEGYFSFDIDSSFGNYKVTLDTNYIPFNVVCPFNDIYNVNVTAGNPFSYDNDFSLRCKNGFDIGVQGIVANRFRPGRHTTVKIEAGDISNFYGVHCASGISGTVTTTFTGQVSYVSPDSGALTPTTVSGNTLTYNIADFGTVDLFSAFNIILLTDTAATIGSNVCITVSVTPLTGDNNPSNNTLSHCFICRGSFDPNEKEADPVSDIDVSGDRWLTYTIHFQNTGTAPAEHIYIIDTLNQNLDLSTFQLLAYSHQPLVQILDSGIAKFNFPNINLPDSNTNEPASHGYIQYKIKLKNSTNVGAQISNTAFIYFDFNSPVVTNTTVNNVTSILGIVNVNNELSVSVYPNPTHNEFTVYCSQFAVGKKIYLKLFDTLGKEVLDETMHSPSCQLHTAELPSGIYFLRIESASGATMKKLIKE